MLLNTRSLGIFNHLRKAANASFWKRNSSSKKNPNKMWPAISYYCFSLEQSYSYDP